MLNNGYTFIADDRQYKVLEKLGSGANTVAYLAQCSHGELVTKCILKNTFPIATMILKSAKHVSLLRARLRTGSGSFQF